MDPILALTMAIYRMKMLEREADSHRLATHARGASVPRAAFRERLSRTARRFRLVVRNSAA
jgi:hypothetical protein